MGVDEILGEPPSLDYGLASHSIELGAAAASECFSSFLSFVSLSPEDHKHQLKHFIYPVFVHLYLESISQDKKLGALEFYEQFSGMFSSTPGYEDAMVELLKIQSENDVVTNPYFKLFRSGEFAVRLSDDCFNYFLDFLKTDTTDILIGLINLYFAVTIVEKDDDECLVRKIIRCTDREAEKKPSTDCDLKDCADAKTSSVSDAGKVMMDEPDLIHSEMKNPPKVCGDSHSVSSDDATSLLNSSDNSQTGKKTKNARRHADSNELKDVGGSSDVVPQGSVTPKKKHIRCSDVVGAISKPFSPRRVEKSRDKGDASRKTLALKAAIDKISKLPQCVPLLCSYNLSCEAQRSVCDVKISWDEKLMASAFNDSSIELYSLVKKPLHVHREGNNVSTVQLHHVDKSPEHCSLKRMQVLHGHSASVYGLSFNRHSSILLSCSGDTTIRAWDMDTYKNVAIYRGHNYPVLGVDYDLFSFRFASASIDATCRLWDTERTYPLALLIGHKSGVGCIKFHPNGKYLATGSADNSVILWHSQEARQMRIFHGHKSEILTLAFSLDGKLLASAGVDKTVKIWDIAAGKLICNLQGHQSPIYSLCFNSDMSLLASGGLEKDIKIWNMEECIDDYKSFKPRSAMKANSYLLSSVGTQCSSVRFVKFSKKNLLTTIGLLSDP